ncbi:LytR/AlgR family response regulator transcription factor [Dyadobacter frigoris]|uniref:Response regulator transcription factor n=1 Tax=Dyadobacter frigoris TaxID=2576211 RepID=A0A4U6D580_9BACT|nr:LytTR family DNA-binding domain-containing protein [Dyadobacter frigoris]TKT92500.1 response regulator transcription factor [Dyadobacter frigoris]GLU55294.1 DNA-binding response regulator [Dyadobacter frigoris]
MRIVIIEDESALALDLAQTLVELDSSIEIVSILKSVEEGKKWFASNAVPDLIFSDIQLGDGLSFEILGSEFIPVIFCTAYDEYALNAFHANGIDYILKPFSSESVDAALRKFRKLTKANTDAQSGQYESIKRLLSEIKSPKPSSILIQYRDTIKPLKIDNIALFRLENGNVHIMTFEREKYYPGKSLEELEEIVGDDFFRVNRQTLVHRKAIVTASSIFSRKLSLNISVPIDESITISKEKAPAFLKWLSET